MNLYLFFHLNLAFSSIEEEERPQVIELCYWPLLNLIEQENIKAGIELSAYTLETIHHLAPDWINKFRNLVTTGKTELIGSGYSQMIAPLAPARVNHWNQAIGKAIYQQYGFAPQLALINEMAYSRGALEHIIDANYKGIIMEWNNPYLYHGNWQHKWRYFPQIITDLQERSLPVIWADSIAFQKFQRFAHREDDLEDYLSFLQSKKRGEEQYFPIYSNDAEIFDYRPGRFSSEEKLTENSEWHRITTLFQTLQKKTDYRFILPSEVLAGLRAENGGHHITLESPEQPIPVKKQEKYNINRWALTGRGDYQINTACHALCHSLKESCNSSDWKKLCYLWSSDFRTHITKKRWKKFTSLLQENSTQHIQTEAKPLPSLTQAVQHNKKYISMQSEQLSLTLNVQKGLAIRGFGEKNMPPLFGTLDHGFYDDITLGADFYSGHTVIETPAKHKITDLSADTLHQDNHSPGNAIFSTCQKKQFLQKKQIKLKQQVLSLSKEISISNRTASRIHPFHFTFIPSSWDFTTLYFATHNGGSKLEYFHFADAKEIHHRDMLSPLVTAKHALGATEGVVLVGDKDKSISFRHQPERCAMIPAIMIRQANDGLFFFRLQYSVQEIDETFHPQKGLEHFFCQLTIKIIKK